MFGGADDTEHPVVKGPSGRGVPSDKKPSPQLNLPFETFPLKTPAAAQLQNAPVACVNALALSAEPRHVRPEVQKADSGCLASETTNRASARPNQRNEVSKSLNEYELLVLPDEHSTVDDSLLRCTPYIVNTVYNVLICTGCRHCVNPERASEHLRQFHSFCKVRKDFSMQLSTKFPGLVKKTIHPPEVIKPIFGLAISKEEYIVCHRCRRGYVNMSTWKRHTCARPDFDLKGGPEHFASHVQTFFLGQNLCYFAVTVPTRASGISCKDDFDLFQTAFRDPAASENGGGESGDYRELNQFLLKEGWFKHLAGSSASELCLITSPPQESEILLPLAREVTALMGNIQAAIGSAGYHVRRLLGKRPA